ncbi:hypothetical protein IPC18_19350 [Pseudomonas aeruginosa]|nr:hypothetical protein IPC18_19350 [Pseudomonas aeruginosa]
MLVTSTSPLHQQSGISRTRKMDLFVDLKVPAVGGSQWTAAERQREEKSLCGNDLQALLDFCGSPQIDAVERAKGIEPSS